eukprot:403360670
MEKEECSICFFQYDKHHKIPRILRCGHTFCQTCLDEIKLPSKHSITCPNCRVKTENVICTKNLPENDEVFNPQMRMQHRAHFVNLNSPYESAKRLMRECSSLMNTSDRFNEYLNKLSQLDEKAENQLLSNYEQEYNKLESISQLLIQMITDYKDKQQQKLTDSLVLERNQINMHMKQIEGHRGQVKDIKNAIQEEVEVELKAIQENESEYLRLQKEYFRRLQEQEEEQQQQQQYVQDCNTNSEFLAVTNSNGGVSCMKSQITGQTMHELHAKTQNDLMKPDSCISGMNASLMADQHQKIKMQEDISIAPDFGMIGGGVASQTDKMNINIIVGGVVTNTISQLNKDILLDVDSSDSLSLKSDSDQSCNNQKLRKQQQENNLCINSSSNSSLVFRELQKVDVGEIESLEQEDKTRVNQVRNQFYSINQKFEQLLKFKSIQKINLWQTELNLEQTYNVFSTFKINEVQQSFEDEVRDFEAQLDLKDYYDVQRPQVVYLSYQNKQLKATKIDILSDTHLQSSVKLINPQLNQKLNLSSCKAIPHPSNTSYYIIDQDRFYLFDSVNDILIQKKICSSLKNTSGHAITHTEGFIYLIGGFDLKLNKSLKQCSRYNIITERWSQLQPMLFDISEAAACSINEYQIVVAGGVNSQHRLTDIVQIYNIRENSWRLFEICLSSPRRQISMISSQKDRVMIIGGRENIQNMNGSNNSGSSQFNINDRECQVVEEIDFLKRNIVNLAPLKVPRSNTSAFQVNDSIYVFGGSNTTLQQQQQLQFQQQNQGVNQQSSLNSMIGEKYVLRENRWREIKSANDSSQNKQQQLFTNQAIGAACLLYE